MKISYYGNTDKGRIRNSNEDYFTNKKISNDEYIFVVADGMGGHQAGDVASKLGTLTFIESYQEYREKGKTIAKSMVEALRKANSTILEKSKSDLKKRGMGTTFSAIVIANLEGYIVHIGDSRIYLIRNDELLRLTKDHTFVEKMIEEGKLTESEARDHPQKNILYMSLGAHENYTPEIRETFKVLEGDIFIMCSDGLNNMVEDEIIKEYSLANSTKKTVDKLIELANKNGGTDNITVQIIHIEEQGETEKTEPIEVVKKKGKIASFFSKFT
jgi:protein phosphatase